MCRRSLLLYKIKTTSGASSIIPAYHHKLNPFVSSTTTVMSVPEPMDVWLKCMAAGAPFYNKVALVIPDDCDNSKRVVQRASNHFGQVYAAPLKQFSSIGSNSMDFGSVSVPSSSNNSNSNSDVKFVFGESPGHLLFSDNIVGESGESRCLSLSSSTALIPYMKYQNPFTLSSSTVPIDDGSVDIVIFASNSFAELATSSDEEMKQTIISDATKKLKAHGVVEIIGMLPFLQIGSETDDISDESHLYRKLKQDYNDFKEMVCSKDFLSPIEASTLVAHDDVYFPFRSVNKQFYVSEYEVTVPQLIAHIRGWECYRRMMSPTMDPDALGVYRLSVCGDPLGYLEDCIVAHLMEHYGAGRNPEVRLPNYKLRVSVTHFVISCSNRPFHILSSMEDMCSNDMIRCEGNVSLSSSRTMQSCGTVIKGITDGLTEDVNNDLGLVPTVIKRRHMNGVRRNTSQNRVH